MQVDKLVRMANQIAAQFAVLGDARAEAAIADHIRQFWEPRMRMAILAHQAEGGAGLSPLASRALRQLPRPAPAQGT